MGWFSTDHLRLAIRMDFAINTGLGIAATEWTALRDVPGFSQQQSKAALVALLYARTLVNQSEGRAELFSRATDAATTLLRGGAFEIADWVLEAGGRSFKIWPWTVQREMVGGKKYLVTLCSSGDTLLINLKMAFGLELVLAPSSALLGIRAVATELHGPDLRRFAETLLAINAYYGRPEAAGAMGSDRKAFAAARHHLET